MLVTFFLRFFFQFWDFFNFFNEFLNCLFCNFLQCFFFFGFITLPRHTETFTLEHLFEFCNQMSNILNCWKNVFYYLKTNTIKFFQPKKITSVLLRKCRYRNGGELTPWNWHVCKKLSRRKTCLKSWGWLDLSAASPSLRYISITSSTLFRFCFTVLKKIVLRSILSKNYEKKCLNQFFAKSSS